MLGSRASDQLFVSNRDPKSCPTEVVDPAQLFLVNLISESEFGESEQCLTEH